MLNDWAGLVEARVMIRAFVVVLSVGLAHPAWADDAPGVCGDGVVDSGEQCDEGGDTATCNANCTLPTCGDGYLNLVAGEECDDGNHATGDGCTATCHVESGYSCVDAVGLPIDCVTICGDGIVAGAEACDDGNTRDGDGCSATCGVEVGWLCSGTACAAICGDGIQVGGEECDDGNSQTGDGCTPRLERDDVRRRHRGRQRAVRRRQPALGRRLLGELHDRASTGVRDAGMRDRDASFGIR